jgi:hypothetical protein
MENNETWGRTNDRFNYNVGRGTYVLINGAQEPVEPGRSFREVVGEHALQAGFGKYRVLLNGEEIKPAQAPELINEGDKVEIRAYDKAGR